MPAPHALPGRRILVIDDEPDCTFELVEHLELNGLSCIGLTDPRAALDIFRQDPAIAIVVSDIKMPGMDGITLAKEIVRSCGDTRPVALVLVTGHAGLGEARQALDLEAVEFILKPIDLDDLDRAITRGFQQIDIQEIDIASLAALRSHRVTMAERPEPSATPTANAAAFLALLEALRTSIADITHGSGLEMPTWFAPGASETEEAIAIDLQELAKHLLEQRASILGRHALRLNWETDETVLAWGRPTIIEAAITRLISAFVLASAGGAELTLGITTASGRARLRVTSSEISPAAVAARPGLAEPGRPAALELGLAAIWTHLASGSLDLATAGKASVAGTLDLPTHP